MSTLKPHLFFEMLDTLVESSMKRRSRDKYYRWKFVYHGICDLALSSQHAYRLVTYLLKNILTDIYRSSSPRCVIFDRYVFTV
uniref:RUN domain-containing protein n=1 Tax=Panagrellus redivivus TaxID=6233 RepID=A0A7E4VL98_PANRE